LDLQSYVDVRLVQAPYEVCLYGVQYSQMHMIYRTPPFLRKRYLSTAMHWVFIKLIVIWTTKVLITQSLKLRIPRRCYCLYHLLTSAISSYSSDSRNQITRCQLIQDAQPISIMNNHQDSSKEYLKSGIPSAQNP
jgi:hypothetical protein